MCQIYGTLVLGFAEGKESYTCLLYEVRIDELGSQLWKHQGAGATILQHCCTEIFPVLK